MLDYTNTYYAIVGVMLPCAVVALILRLIARHLTKAAYGPDDALAVLALLGAAGFITVILTWATNYGLGRPDQYFLPETPVSEIDRKDWFFLFLTSETYTFAIAFCKFAILAFYWRIFKYTSIRIPIQVVSALTIAWFILRLFMVNLQCIPIQTLWDPSITDGKCGVNKPTFFFSTGLSHLLIEVALIVLPAIVLGKMHLPTGQKIAVMLLFMFGILTCISSIVVAVTGSKFDPHAQELGLDLATHLAWSTAEVNLALISTSLPMLRPIFRKIIPGSLLTSNSGEPSHLMTLESGGARHASFARKKSRNNERGNSTNERAGAGQNWQDNIFEWDPGARAAV